MILLCAMILVLIRLLYSIGEAYYERDFPRSTWRGLAISLGVLFACFMAY